jgi:hypothetical protein
MVKAFPPVVRFSGLSFSYNVAYAIFGGLTPMVVSLLLKESPMGAGLLCGGAVCVVGLGWGGYLCAGALNFAGSPLAPSPGRDDGLSSNCHISAIECSHGLLILGPVPTPYLLGVRHETEAFDGGNDFCRCWRCDCQRGCRC